MTVEEVGLWFPSEPASLIDDTIWTRVYWLVGMGVDICAIFEYIFCVLYCVRWAWCLVVRICKVGGTCTVD